MTRPTVRTLRCALAGAFLGYGVVSWICFFAAEVYWAHIAPQHPNRGLGLIYRNDDHGSYTYFSPYQATACALLLATSFPLLFLAFIVVPKRPASTARGWWEASLKWDNNHPGPVAKWSLIATAVAAPFIIRFVESAIVRHLNAAGIVWNTG